MLRWCFWWLKWEKREGQGKTAGPFLGSGDWSATILIGASRCWMTHTLFVCCSNEQGWEEIKNSERLSSRASFYRARSSEDWLQTWINVDIGNPFIGKNTKSVQIRNQSLKEEGKMEQGKTFFKDKGKPAGLRGNGNQQVPVYHNWLFPSGTAFLFTGSS